MGSPGVKRDLFQIKKSSVSRGPWIMKLVNKIDFAGGTEHAETSAADRNFGCSALAYLVGLVGLPQQASNVRTTVSQFGNHESGKLAVGAGRKNTIRSVL
jgi:hypothetical protein